MIPDETFVVRNVMPSHFPKGVALVTAMLLLLVLSLLAIAGMNSATLEFIMAGNEQYKQTAFQNADTGAQVALLTVPVTASGATGLVGSIVTGNPVGGSSTDTYDYGQYYDGSGNPLGNSSFTMSGYYFHFEATSTSKRGATATIDQGVAITGGKDPELAPMQTLCSGGCSF